MTPSTELLDAIRADPDADRPRLALADWLAAHDQPERAEYLRLAVAIEHLPVSLLPGHTPARRRMHELHRAHYKAWQAERPTLDGVRWAYHRGLLEHVWFDSYTAFQRQNAAALGHLVTRVGFSNLRAPRRLFDSPALAGVRELDMRSCSGFDVAAALMLAACPHLSGLRHLTLPGSACTPAVVSALANAPTLSGLRELVLGSTYSQVSADPAGVAALADSPYLTGLTRLDLGRMRVGPRGAERLLESDTFGHLTWLDLGENGFGPHGLDALGDGSRLASLEYLRLNSNSLGDEGPARLADAHRLTRLRVLLLNGNLIGNEGARRLASAEHLAGLSALSLSGNAVGGPGLMALIDANHFDRLEGLDVSGNLIGDDALLALGRSEDFPRLRVLEVSNVPARRELVTLVVDRFREGKKPLKDAPELPPLPPVVRATAPVGHADEDGLLEAIIAAPEDDLPRMVYADWLEDHGEADRASLLRQGDGADAGLLARATPAIPKEFVGTIHQSQFERGLLTVRVQMRGLLTKAFQAAGPPWLRAQRVFRLVIYGATKDWSKVAAMPLLSQVRMLQVDQGSLKREGLAALVGSPHLGRLFGLDLSGNQLNYHDKLRALMTAATLPSLCNLSLADNYIGVDTVRQLVTWRPARKLTALSLARNWIGAGGVALLANSEFTSELTQLDLGFNYLPDQAVHALIESPALAKLTHLWLRNNSLSDAGIHALAGSPFLRRLQRLDLSSNRFTGDAALALARSPNLGPTCKLHVWPHSFTAGTMAQMREVLGPRLVTEGAR